MKISLYLGVYLKTIPWKFINVHPRNPGVIYPWNFYFSYNSRLIFQIFCCFCRFINKHFSNTDAYISKSKPCYNAKPAAYHFYLRTNILLNFRIRISVPFSKTRITDSDVNIPRNDILRCDRNKNGGGVVRYIRMNLCFNTRTLYCKEIVSPNQLLQEFSPDLQTKLTSWI